MLPSVKIKICGITSRRDAELAASLGADALGFIFHEKSPRFIAPAAAGEITRELPPFMSKVGVFVNAPEDSIRRAIDEAGLDTVQLHGEEPPEVCAAFRLPVIKAFRVKDSASLEGIERWEVSAWLLDSYVPGAHGGTGERFNWEVAQNASRLGLPIILAGGLVAGNVASAIDQVRPYAVDVSSGVESSPGRKDPDKLRAFIQAVRG